MEEASLELRNAIHLALLVDDDVVANAADRLHRHQNQDGEVATNINNDNINSNNNNSNNNNADRSSSEEGTSSYVSSLSGSLPQHGGGGAHRTERRRCAIDDARRSPHDAASSSHGRGGDGGVGGGGMRGAGGGGGGCEEDRARWRDRRLIAATRVEAAASDYESALLSIAANDDDETRRHRRNINERRDLGYPFDEEWGGDGKVVEVAEEEDDGGGSIVDYLVALLTSVPRTLLMRSPHHIYDDGGDNVDDAVEEDNDVDEDVRDVRRESEYRISMARICHNVACISSDVLRGHFVGGRARFGNRRRCSHLLLGEGHVYDMIDEVVRITCDAYHSSADGISNLNPIIGLLNRISEERDVERAMYECEHDGIDGKIDDCRTTDFFVHLSSRESLRLMHILMNRYVCDHDGQCDEASGHIGYFASRLLRHFAYVVGGEVGCDSPDGCPADPFGAWALGTDEHMVPRLDEDEARDIHVLIARYHVVGIHAALYLIERAESVVGGCSLEGETVEGDPDGIAMALSDAVRSIATIVDTAEAMDALCLGHDPEIHVVLRPLMSSYARFVGSCLHDALLFSRSACDGTTPDVENATILADNLLFRLCRVAVGAEALECSAFREADDVLALSLLRAVNYPCIAGGGAGFLLDASAVRARAAAADAVATTTSAIGEPTPKRPRRRAVSGLGGGRSPDEGRVDMTDVLLACLALSLSNQEYPDPSCSKRAYRIASSLFLGREENASGDVQDHRAVIDPLNPWHTIHARRMQGLASLCDDDDNRHDASRAYASAIPHLLNTKNL